MGGAAIPGVDRVPCLHRRESVLYNLRESKVISVRHLLRSSRSRRAFVWCCVPYLFLSVFADFLHVHPLFGPGSRVGIVHQIASVPTQRPHQIPDASCAICQWQRIRPRLQAAMSGSPAILSVPTLVVAVAAAFPESPVPHPSAFRGPPQPSFS